jgi:hypothetical protein
LNRFRFGLDLTERLLFMTESAIQEIPGIGETALAEIRAYRARFEQKRLRPGCAILAGLAAETQRFTSPIDAR